MPTASVSTRAPATASCCPSQHRHPRTGSRRPRNRCNWILFNHRLPRVRGTPRVNSGVHYYIRWTETVLSYATHPPVHPARRRCRERIPPFGRGRADREPVRPPLSGFKPIREGNALLRVGVPVATLRRAHGESACYRSGLENTEPAVPLLRGCGCARPRWLIRARARGGANRRSSRYRCVGTPAACASWPPPEAAC